MQIDANNDDPIRQYTDEEQKLLTRNLYEITERVRNFDCHSEFYSIGLICDWHRILFRDVKGHAGRYRTAFFGEEYINFGPHRSANRKDVEKYLIEHVEKVKRYIGRLNDNNENQLIFPKDIITVAIWSHADFIKIHPFTDGNGRIGRLICNFILMKFGLPAIVVEVVKPEYIDCLNHFYVTNNIDLLYKLYLRLYSNML